MRFNLTQKLLIGPLKLRFDLTVARFNLIFDFFNSVFMNGDFDPRFVFIVAPTEQVVNADNSFYIRQNIRYRQEIT